MSIDEVHQHKDNSVHSAIYKGQRALLEALLSMITTGARIWVRFGYEFDSLCIAILEGGCTDESIFADIYTIDENDNIFDPKHYIKSNPVLCATEHGM